MIGQASKRVFAPEYLRECFALDEETGLLTWRKRPVEHFSSARVAAVWNGHWAGKAAFSHCENGYRRGSLDGKTVKAHQIVYALAAGVWPEQSIDHINGDRSDNRPANLRSASTAENAKNKRRYANNTTGVAGVTRTSRGGKFEAWINIKGKQTCLGTFATIDDAADAREEAAKREGYHENHGRN